MKEWGEIEEGPRRSQHRFLFFFPHFLFPDYSARILHPLLGLIELETPMGLPQGFALLCPVIFMEIFLFCWIYIILSWNYISTLRTVALERIDCRFVSLTHMLTLSAAWIVRGMAATSVSCRPLPSFLKSSGGENEIRFISSRSGRAPLRSVCVVRQVCKRPPTARARCNGQKRPNRANKLSPRGSGRSFGCGRGYSRYGSTLWLWTAMQGC